MVVENVQNMASVGIPAAKPQRPMVMQVVVDGTMRAAAVDTPQPLHPLYPHYQPSTPTPKMLARAAFRAASAPTLVARRGFQSTRAQMASPYHYPEGPRSNLPFDPLKRGFAFKYWGFMGERCRSAIGRAGANSSRHRIRPSLPPCR